MISRSSVGTARPPAVSRLESVAHDLDRFDTTLAEDRDRRHEEAQPNGLSACPPACARRSRAGCPCCAGRACRPRRRRARGVELELGRIDDHVGAGELAQLASSGGVNAAWAGPRRPSITTRAIRELAIASIAASVVSVGASSSGVSASMRATSRATFPFPITTARSTSRSNVRSWKSGMAVVPGHELERRPRAGKILARDPELPVGLRADGVDNGVVQPRQVVVVQVAPDLDVAEEPKARFFRDSLEGARDRLQLRVVGRNAETDEPPRRRQPLDHVDLDGYLGVEQRPGGIEARRAQSRRLRREAELTPISMLVGTCFRKFS